MLILKVVKYFRLEKLMQNYFISLNGHSVISPSGILGFYLSFLKETIKEGFSVMEQVL